MGTSADGGPWSSVTGGTNASLTISSPVIGNRYRLKVSTGVTNQECYSNVLVLTPDTNIPQFPVTPSKYSGGIKVCDQSGPVDIPYLITNIDAVDNCTEIADLRTSYTITLPDNSTVSGTNVNISVLNTAHFS